MPLSLPLPLPLPLPYPAAAAAAAAVRLPTLLTRSLFADILEPPDGLVFPSIARHRQHRPLGLHKPVSQVLASACYRIRESTRGRTVVITAAAVCGCGGGCASQTSHTSRYRPRRVPACL